MIKIRRSFILENEKFKNGDKKSFKKSSDRIQNSYFGSIKEIEELRTRNSENLSRFLGQLGSEKKNYSICMARPRWWLIREKKVDRIKLFTENRLSLQVFYRFFIDSLSNQSSSIYKRRNNQVSSFWKNCSSSVLQSMQDIKRQKTWIFIKNRSIFWHRLSILVDFVNKYEMTSPPPKKNVSNNHFLGKCQNRFVLYVDRRFKETKNMIFHKQDRL